MQRAQQTLFIGHAAGDAALKLVAETLKNNIRSDESLIAFVPTALPGYIEEEKDQSPEGVLARIGGDEFLIVLDGATEDEARDILNRLNKAFETLTLEWDGKPIKVGASIGMETFKQGDDIEGIKAKADRAMYAVKKAKDYVPR